MLTFRLVEKFKVRRALEELGSAGSKGLEIGGKTLHFLEKNISEDLAVEN